MTVAISRKKKMKTKTTCDGCDCALTLNRTIALGTYKFCFACHSKLWEPGDFRKKFNGLWGT